MSHAEAEALIDSLTSVRVQPITYEVMRATFEIHEQDYDGLRVINPFVD